MAHTADVILALPTSLEVKMLVKDDILQNDSSFGVSSSWDLSRESKFGYRGVRLTAESSKPGCALRGVRGTLIILKDQIEAHIKDLGRAIAEIEKEESNDRT